MVEFRFASTDSFESIALRGLASSSSSITASPSFDKSTAVPNSMNDKPAILTENLDHQNPVEIAIKFPAKNAFDSNDETTATIGVSPTIPKVRKSERIRSILSSQSVPPASMSSTINASSWTEPKKTEHAKEAEKNGQLK